MLSLILTCLLAFCATLVGMPSLIAVAKRKHLVDEPTEARKIHHRSVPTIGGLMVFAALMSSSLVSFAIQQPDSSHLYVWVGILGAAMLVFFMGLKDDIVVMSASRKLFVHMAVGAYLVGALDLRIDNFGGLFGLGHIPFWVSAPFSWFVYIVVVNAVNLIDGLDGLIGGFGTLVMASFGVWFFQSGDLASAIVAFSTAGALLGFLVFNFNPARIFMGDGGSLLLGLLVYAMAIQVMQTPVEAALDGLVQACGRHVHVGLSSCGHPQGVHLEGAGRTFSVLTRPLAHPPQADGIGLGPQEKLRRHLAVHLVLCVVGIFAQQRLVWIGCDRTICGPFGTGLRHWNHSGLACAGQVPNTGKSSQAQPQPPSWILGGVTLAGQGLSISDLGRLFFGSGPRAHVLCPAKHLAAMAFAHRP